MPIILALSFNEIRYSGFKKFTQTISYLPNFVSVVIIIGIMKEFLNLNTGVVNYIIAAFGREKLDFFSQAEWFRPIYILSGIWQTAGFGSIIYLAAISGINSEMYEAAYMDGSNRLKNIFYITIPSIMPTIVVMFILAVGNILSNDYAKIILMYVGATYETADVMQTWVYRIGVLGGQYGIGAAVGLLNSAASFIFLFAANSITRKYEGNSIW